MSANQQDTWCLDDDERVEVPLRDVQQQDAFWEQAHARENYFRPGLGWDDYAPAYCVGYTGWFQYGGNFEDAEKSLVSNWVRIKGDSRLGLDEALMAIRAAWDRLALRDQPQVAAQPVRQRAARPRRSRWGRLLEGALALKRDLDRGIAGARPASRAMLVRR